MPRTNFKNVQKLIAEATAVAIEKLMAERQLDAQHITEHVKASEDMIERLTALEDMIRDLILFEKQRITALQGHKADIESEEPALPEPQQFKKIMGGKS